MSKEGVNKRKDPPSGFTSESPKTPKVDPKVIELDGTESAFDFGTQLSSVRDVYGNPKLWLEDRDSKRKITVPTTTLEGGHVYYIRIPKDMIPDKPIEAEKRTKAQICDDLVAALPSASTFAKSKDSLAKAWRYSTKATQHIKAHRIASDTPVVLLDRVLSDLYDDIVDKKYNPTHKDCTYAWALMERLSRGFEDEANMLEYLIKEWGQYYGWTLVRHGNADANWIVNDCMVLNLETKNEKGTGTGCSYMQNLNYYSKHWAERKVKALSSHCPTILIEITGPEIAVNGAVFSDAGILCDPFFTASLLCNEYDHNHMCTVARVIGAISKAAKQLVTNYAKNDIPHDGFPWFRHYQTSEGEQVRIKYNSNVEDKCLVFQAEAIQESGEKCPIIVKFAPTYCSAAHKLCEQAECAPALLHESQVCRFRVIVMEKIENAMHWHKITDKTQRDAAKAKIQTVVNSLHSGGLVHGDLRATNILVAGMRVALIDFDWSGPLTTKYPLFINRDIKWPEGVADGGEIAVEHDQAWISREFL